MIRPNVGKGFVILEKDLGDTVQRKSYNNNGSIVIEYWIYQHEPFKSKLTLPIATLKELEKKQPLILKSIICTKDNTDHIQKVKNLRIYYIKGIKIDNEKYLDDPNRPHKDLNLYLSKTHRK